ncbi:copper amine oxidase N-terminal domain-containing protein [Paenibacillus sedimenti]|uniref:Copper amine oxidase N-terminal domain-containing protein n=1 Tax=Paenibacillus sedimenti TaxID=2770274 RepID=A0A926KXX9_9BACL|nr:copper amine oxidase N-terminal domain-containing protein [Paenibacillus sedimenti]MBD0384906.1 copper amine oxidase N-terminal domain-containing protein [Paenibacillus sedimenti]
MFKKTIATLVAVTVIFGGAMSTPAMAAPGKDLRILPVIVNGQKAKFPDTEPYINTDGRTMVPVRFVSEMLGAEVKWEIDTQTAIVLYDGKTIRMPIGSKTITVDGTKQELDTAAEFAEGRTMVPLRFVSEVLGSEVEWDNAAHAVKVTDAEYQAKVDAGTVKLDSWGREYSKTFDANWMKLTDLESTNFYTGFKNWKGSRSYLETARDWDYKEFADQWAQHIRNYYEVQLNFDYRTVNSKSFADTLVANMGGMTDNREYPTRNIMAQYVEFAKKNKVVTKGYADPELSSAFYGGGFVWVPTHFKFMIVSATDSAQTFVDNYDVSTGSDSPELKKGVWYDGYALIRMYTNYGNMEHKFYGVYDMENMFMKGNYFYDIQE